MSKTIRNHQCVYSVELGCPFDDGYKYLVQLKMGYAFVETACGTCSFDSVKDFQNSEIIWIGHNGKFTNEFTDENLSNAQTIQRGSLYG